MKFAYVTCNLKPLAFCMHHNFKSIQKQPINCSQGKMLGKNHDFDAESFSKAIKFIRDIFLTRNFNCNAVEVTEVNFKTSVCFFTFNSLKFMPTVDDRAFYVFLSKVPNEQGIFLFVHWKLA